MTDTGAEVETGSDATVAAALDAAALRRALGLFATGVTVITVQHGDVVHGMTANAFTSVSLDPPLVLFCVTRTARMASLIADASGFAINVLAGDQMHVSRHFAGARKQEAEPGVTLRPGSHAPLVEGALAALTCERHAIYDGGDHLIVVGRVLRVELHTEADRLAPLAFFRSRYADVRERVPVAAPDATVTVGDAEMWQNDAILIYHDEWQHVDPWSVLDPEPDTGR